MNAVEFVADLSELKLPERVVRQLPVTGRARIIILTGMDEEDAAWQQAAYGEFLRDDTPEDAIYEQFDNAVR
jgi:hypothetical protein